MFRIIQKWLLFLFFFSSLPTLGTLPFKLIMYYKRNVLRWFGENIDEKYKEIFPFYAKILELKEIIPDNSYIYQKPKGDNLARYLHVFLYPRKLISWEKFKKLRDKGVKNLYIIEYKTEEDLKIKYIQIKKIR